MSTRLLEKLFELKIGESTPVIAEGGKEFIVGTLREIKKSSIGAAQFEQAKKQLEEEFKTEILQEYNQFLMKKNPLKTNDKLLGAKEETEKK